MKDYYDTICTEGRVVVVDNNPVVQHDVYFWLRDCRIKVGMCGDVSESLHLIHELHPDVIVLGAHFAPDIVFGRERDGFWLMEWLHRVDDLKDIPVIMTSKDGSPTTRERALASGAAAFLVKPFDKGKFVQLVQELIARKAELKSA